MAFRSALRNAVGKRGGSEIVRRTCQRLACVSYNFRMPLLWPAISPSSSLLVPLVEKGDYDESEPQSSTSGRSPAVESPNPCQWSGSHGEMVTTLDDMSQRRLFWFLRSHLPPCWIIPGPSPGVHIGGWNSRHWCWQVRLISSSGPHSSPRKMERYSGRVIDRDPKSRRHAKFDENFRPLPVVKKSLSEYRQSTVEKSTKNMALVPKRWKRGVPSKEVVDAVMYLTRAKRNPDAVKEVLRKRIARLLKLELMMVLADLQRLDEWLLARQVFNAVRKETWYKPNVYLYQTMVQTFGRSKQINEAKAMLEELQAEGLQPDDSIKRELLRAYVSCGMIPDAVELYKEIQKLGLDRAARSILFHGLNEEEKLQLSAYEKKQGYDWS